MGSRGSRWGQDRAQSTQDVRAVSCLWKAASCPVQTGCGERSDGERQGPTGAQGGCAGQEQRDGHSGRVRRRGQTDSAGPGQDRGLQLVAVC